MSLLQQSACGGVGCLISPSGPGWRSVCAVLIIAAQNFVLVCVLRMYLIIFSFNVLARFHALNAADGGWVKYIRKPTSHIHAHCRFVDEAAATMT
jgi:hypothetical protein